MKKRYLFFFVHPAKVHLFKSTINSLLKDGHEVEVVITGRDILEELVQKQGWEYTKIFSKGRKVSFLHIYLSAAIFLVLTVVRLLWLTKLKKYDFFITDDVLTFVGRLKGVPSIFATDDDLSAVPESFILMKSANYIFAPSICELGKYNDKKLGYYGYKSLAHLHPNRFKPEEEKIPSSYRENKYFFIRTVSATSTHDVGKRGISDNTLRKIIEKLEPYGKVILNSERELPEDLQSYQLDFNKNDVSHYVYHASIFISDSTTMCAEAAVLGVPAIEYDDWFADFKQYYELNEEYELLYGFGIEEEEIMLSKIDEILAMDNRRDVFQKRREHMLNDKIDVSAFLIWFLNNYPESVDDYFSNKDSQLKFNGVS
jgi:predicted glycosyltransferase